jgi:hypothetical protein
MISPEFIIGVNPIEKVIPRPFLASLEGEKTCSPPSGDGLGVGEKLAA